LNSKKYREERNTPLLSHRKDNKTMTNNETLQKCTCLQVDGRGKTIICLEGYRAMINLWGLQNTNGKKTTYIADKETGKVIRIYKGNGKDFPTIIKEDEMEEELYLTEKGDQNNDNI